MSCGVSVADALRIDTSEENSTGLLSTIDPSSNRAHGSLFHLSRSIVWDVTDHLLAQAHSFARDAGARLLC